MTCLYIKIKFCILGIQNVCYNSGISQGDFCHLLMTIVYTLNVLNLNLNKMKLGMDTYNTCNDLLIADDYDNLCCIKFCTTFQNTKTYLFVLDKTFSKFCKLCIQKVCYNNSIKLQRGF